MNLVIRGANQAILVGLRQSVLRARPRHERWADEGRTRGVRFFLHLLIAVGSAWVLAGPPAVAADGLFDPKQKPTLESRCPVADIFHRDDLPVEVRFSRDKLKESHLAVLKEYPSIERLWLNNKSVKTTWWVHLKDLRALTFLELSSSSIDDAGLLQFVGLQRLQDLGLYDCASITDEGMKSVAKLASLETLILEETKIGDRGLAFLTPLKKLKLLNISRTRVSDEGLIKYIKEFPALKVLGISIYEGGAVTLQGIRRIHAELPGLELRGHLPREMKGPRTSQKNDGRGPKPTSATPTPARP